MKETKVSAVVGLSVTLLAVVTAVAFSFATLNYQREVVKLRKVNAEYRQSLDEYKAVLAGIKDQLMKVEEATK
ncbi:MAG TPA: hypothetical protein PLU24_00315 [Candidatus Omnitrophota bacterium]|nr:hypothetical protein [Candidatus Omnitrophota bacterium]